MDRKLTAVTTQDGVYEFLVMPQGLATSPFFMQRLMDTVLLEHRNYSRGYLDDIIIFSKSFEEHVQHAKNVFLELKTHNLNINEEKTKVAQKDVKYCGFRVSEHGISTDERIVTAVKEFPNMNDENLTIAKRKSRIQSFQGLAGYYRRFIKNFSDLEKPLRDASKAGAEWISSE